MERPRCKICSKAFSNGRALGGHMRSHLVTLPIPPKKQTQSCSCSEDEKVLIYGLRENPKKSFRLVDPEFLDAVFVVEDRESETESTKNTTRKRSKRVPRRNGEKKHISTEEEDIALCLMMLSRDDSLSHKTSRRKIMKKYCSVDSHEERESRGERKRRVKKNFISATDVKLHECPLCYKVFGSGQALGGHKRAHFLVSSTTPTPTKAGGSGSLVTSGKFNNNLVIDLNLPAPMEDDEEVSAVSSIPISNIDPI